MVIRFARYESFRAPSLPQSPQNYQEGEKQAPVTLIKWRGVGNSAYEKSLALNKPLKRKIQTKLKA